MKTRILLSMIALVAVCMQSCNEFVELEAPKTEIVSAKVFGNDAGARASVSGIFSQMMNGAAFASGGIWSVAVVGGLSSDEFINHSTSQIYLTLFNNSVTPVNNSAISTNWNDMYLTVYEANAILEGCAASDALADSVRNQVVGEAKFIRAFAYFYLTNLFGDVPLVTGTDYRVNKSLPRTASSEVYKQIERDLTDAQNLLLPDFSMSGGEKVEPNKWAATALLARAYLYQEKWAEAEVQSSAIINSNSFRLVDDLNSAFLKNSDEAIWQLMPVAPGFNTNEGQLMIIPRNPTRWSLSPSSMAVFDASDLRLASWVGVFTSGGKSYYYPFKYKIRFVGEPLEEYYMVLRFAEQYLIRAEARAMQNDLIGAVNDLNILRNRAGLADIDGSTMTQVDIVTAIARERRAEMFAEWGHRWFDLKRSGHINEILGPLKPDWQSTDALFPIPQAEIVANPNIVQNP